MYTVVVTLPDNTVIAQTNFRSEFSAWKYWLSMKALYPSSSARFMARPFKRAA